MASVLDSAKKIKVRATLIDEMLATSPNNPDIYKDYIASKGPDGVNVEEQIEAMGTEAFIEKSMTVFPHTKDGDPCLFAYQIKGFLKEAFGAMKRVDNSKCSAIKAHKKVVDLNVFVQPDFIPVKTSGDIGECTRPLRASTAQGERVSLACSESIPAGSTLEFEIVLLDKKLEDAVYEALDYGELHGLLQWRNSGKGRFVWDEIE